LIRSFRHKGLKRLYAADPKGVHAVLRSKAANILAVLDMAGTIEHADLPGFRLHELNSESAGVWSISLNKNWRITFRMEDGDAHDLDLTDYH
jgi:toxin HigB-1